MSDISYFSEDCGQTLTPFEHHIAVTDFELSANSNYIIAKSVILCEANI